MPRLPTVSRESIALALQTNGPMSAQALADKFGVDRARISRLLNEAPEHFVQFGATRRSRFAMRRNVKTAGSQWPIYEIDEAGRTNQLAVLESYHGGWCVRWASPAPAWSDVATDTDGWSEGFPFFVTDMRPQGFLGRGIARQVAMRLPVPRNAAQWSDDDTVVYLQSEGEDAPGNLVLGEHALRQSEEARDVINRDVYPELARRAIEGGPPGSSAAGEYPKFLARVQNASGVSPVLVKFSPPLDSAIGRRWGDLLAAESIASSILAEVGQAQTDVRTFDIGGRRFLEVPRYDRIGDRGRRGVVSLQALLGIEGAPDTTDWIVGADYLRRIDMISDATMAQVRERRAFGDLIGNTDMHPGNLSFFLGRQRVLELTPSYDMLPMLWAPTIGGEIAPQTFSPSLPDYASSEQKRTAAHLAATFWNRVMTDPRMSQHFASIANECAEKVAALRKGEYSGGPGAAQVLPEETATGPIEINPSPVPPAPHNGEKRPADEHEP